MRYELEALFYEKKGDTKPRYKVPMGLVPYGMYNFEKLGFQEDPESTPGYLDYIKKRVRKADLEVLTQEGYVCEMLDLWYGVEKFYRVDIRAMEIDVIDDEGTVPPKGFFIGGIFVEFDATDYSSPVTFIDGDPYRITESTKVAKVHLGALKRYFGVKTQNEVAGKIRRMRKERWHNFEELEKWIGKVLSCEPKAITLYSDDFEIRRSIDVSKEGDKFRVDQQDLGPGGFEDERCLTASFDEVKAAVGANVDFEVLRLFVGNFYEEDAFDRIEDWLSENGIKWEYWGGCR